MGSEGGGELGTRLDRETSRRDVPGDDSFSVVKEELFEQLPDLEVIVSSPSTEHPDSVLTSARVSAS